MSSDEDDRTGTGERASSSHARTGGDPVRELLLAFAAQIDQVASWFATDPHPGGVGTAEGGSGVATDFRQVISSMMDVRGVDVAGEITALLRESADLLARLISVFIAILEAVAQALRAAPPDAGPAPRHYQPIAVRLDSPAGDTASDRSPVTTTRPEGQL